MTELAELKSHYRWTELDEKNILLFRPFAEKRADEFIQKFYGFIAGFGDVNKFLHSEEVVHSHQEKVKRWFIDLFAGRYDEDYMRMLFKIGLTHVKIGLPPHYVNATVAFIRDFINETISDAFHDRVTRDNIRNSCSKLLDMNLDIINASYREEELRQYLSTSKLQKTVINGISRFSFLLDTFLVIILAVLAVIATVFVVGEISKIFLEPYAANKVILGVLGDLLILWSVSELIQEGIKHTRGSKFAVKSFVAVGLAACIREILIASLGHQTETILVLTFTTLSLGMVYFLLSKSQSNI
jgi:uncharacterized membrane protein (DUF373 family)